MYEKNWGPRPSRMLKCWQDMSGYQQFVKDKWHSYQIGGWGGYLLREKLKLIKLALKEWHSVHAQNIPGRIDSLKSRLSVFDEKGEGGELSIEEVEEMRGITLDIHSMSHINTSISLILSIFIRWCLAGGEGIPLSRFWLMVILWKGFNLFATLCFLTLKIILRPTTFLGQGLKIDLSKVYLMRKVDVW